MIKGERTMTTRFVDSRSTAVILTVGCLFAIASTASAATLDAVADNFISAANQTTNYGDSTSMNVLNSNGITKDRIAFIRFDLSGYTGGTVTSSSLIVQPFDGPTSAEFEVYGIQDLGADENFNEMTQTFANSPYGDTTQDGSLDKTGLELLGSFDVTSADFGTDVTISSASLTAFLNNDTNDIATFVLFWTNSTDPGNFNKFYTSEAASGSPRLTIVPEPSSMALIGLGLFGMVSRARRRRC